MAFDSNLHISLKNIIQMYTWDDRYVNIWDRHTKVTIKRGGQRGIPKGYPVLRYLWSKYTFYRVIYMELFYHVTIQSHMWFLRRYVEFKKYSNIRNNIENYSSLVSFLKNEIWKVTNADKDNNDVDKDNNGDDKYLRKRTVKGDLTGRGSSPIRILLALLLSFSHAEPRRLSAAADVKWGGVGLNCYKQYW